MTKFLTISPTHIPGKKSYAWENFKRGNYIALGWSHTDYSGWTIDKVLEDIKRREFDNESSAISSFTKFLEIEIGDYVAVNNVSFGLFGVGKISSGYKFEKYKHDTGADDKEEFYSHFRTVEWIITDYYSKKDLISEGETPWQPYGTTGSLFYEIPPYIKRLLGEPIKKSKEKIEYIEPNFLKNVIEGIKKLKNDSDHLERAHESLVEDLFCSLGYVKHEDIKFRHSRLDLSIWNNEKPILLIEVKRFWNLNWKTHTNELKQAYGYSLDKGIRYILLTNGDYYALFDRLKGLTYESNLIGEFRLSSLMKEELVFIERLKKESLLKPNLGELFKYIAESFE